MFVYITGVVDLCNQRYHQEGAVRGRFTLRVIDYRSNIDHADRRFNLKGTIDNCIYLIDAILRVDERSLSGERKLVRISCSV